MMIVPDLIFLNGLLLASAGACPAMPPPQIEVRTVFRESTIHHTLDKAALKETKSDTDLPYQMQNLADIETGGMMRGDIHVGYQIDMGDVPVAATDAGLDICVRYKTIVVTLDLAPEIFIARDYAADSCWYHEIREHEESHIDMDKVVIGKYAERITDGLKMAFSGAEDSASGPVGEEASGALKKQMGAAVMGMVDVMVRDMTRERLERQAGVDSVAGYGYIMNTCYDGDNVYRIPE